MSVAMTGLMIQAVDSMQTEPDIVDCLVFVVIRILTVSPLMLLTVFILLSTYGRISL